MATTTNYAWTTPDDSSLVKDGASAIRALGTAIDTSMNTALGTKKAGMVLLNTTSFSGVSSQSFNDVFSSTYDNYRIVTSILGTTNDPDDITLRFRVSGADNTNSTYERIVVRIGSTLGSTQQGSQTSLFAGATSTQYGGVSLDVLRPNLATITTVHGTGAYNANTEMQLNFGFFNAATVFTGFSLIALSGNMTGAVSVYGYNK